MTLLHEVGGEEYKRGGEVIVFVSLTNPERMTGGMDEEAKTNKRHKNDKNKTGREEKMKRPKERA